MIKKLTLATILMAACFVFTGVVHAEDIATDPNITVNNPTLKRVYYKGENINYDVIISNPWSYYWCRPFVSVIKDGSNKTVALHAYNYMYPGKTWRLKKKINTAKFATGKYYFVTMAMPIYPGTTVEVPLSTDKPYAGKAIYVRTLKAPTSVKAGKAKKGIKVTYKKAKGANKYNIYRSTKKTSGYKKIFTTKKTTFINKSAIKGKRYYYKVKSVRSVNKYITSKYSLRTSAIAK